MHRLSRKFQLIPHKPTEFSHSLGVKQRKTQREQMSSGLPLIADIDGFSHVRDRQQNVNALKPDKKVIRSRTPFGSKVQR